MNACCVELVHDLLEIVYKLEDADVEINTL